MMCFACGKRERKSAVEHWRIRKTAHGVLSPHSIADGSMDAYSVVIQPTKGVGRTLWREVVALIRLHPNVMSKAKDLDIDGINTFDATRYDDMQEFLAADAVISDYSSLGSLTMA